MSVITGLIALVGCPEATGSEESLRGAVEHDLTVTGIDRTDRPDGDGERSTPVREVVIGLESSPRGLRDYLGGGSENEILGRGFLGTSDVPTAVVGVG